MVNPMTDEHHVSVNQADADCLDSHRTSPLRFPLHVLDGDGEPLCGSMADDQCRFLERHEHTDQPTLREKGEDQRLSTFLLNLCGNCRRALLAESDSEELEEAWERAQGATGRVEA